MRVLNTEDIELIHLQIIDASGGLHGLRSKEVPSSAVASQTQSVFGKDAYFGIWQKAAALARGIICNHPFLDGNKRTGIISALALIELNSIKLSISDQDLEDFAVKVAVENLDIPQITAWLQARKKA